MSSSQLSKAADFAAIPDASSIQSQDDVISGVGIRRSKDIEIGVTDDDLDDDTDTALTIHCIIGCNEYNVGIIGST